ncbi:GTPase RhebL1 isoform X2 [Neophocaena asiaeorientalis asiaeorientalis]|uniref:GTPase RhebL1 isoform X5 n=4 Tax=Cetacea TaxID=9721 RepID=A0A2U4BA16_TURTR|nr:GTPase RhebL1 isoform X5 [Tursiops truncatus]XP_024592786.1 GTPase RhebL1 isoform X2 [Neophocaena asiaeorientalis asiaeorientalis]XP_026961951.1 GTPase RhebL1 isoform X5 [Lagenorhynchus obliquidens]XP_032501923.1 GTPase RhebL1 isoform X2 [Phocoena sinus]XP_033292305.1 GTPase RhebL1 isoform X4 [Orcinus orca]XP_036722624.1 GTPase RhebL1 isoform X2 [Balaenoptera musculus]XP_057413140.1 GTPase RhebL1 isoform X2 [Balaenoptera acutorostrata]XP_059882178.1 GTPase RhebL1 isoform X2 [Delphinus del
MPLVRYRKVVILGYRSVGKTSLAHQFVEGEFLEGYDPTVENTYSKIVTLGKDEFHLHLVDTAGQDEYSILPYSFIIGVHGYVLVYSVTSLHRLPVVLVGNKADLSPDREVQAVEGKKLAESWGATFMESSARDKQLTQGIFTKVIQEIARVENSYGQERRCHLM